MTRFAALMLPCLLVLVPPAWAGETDAHGLPVVSDLQVLAVASAARGIPVVLMVSSSDCGYCARLASEVFAPLLLNKDDSKRLSFRELLLDGDDELKDFEGMSVSAPDFASRYEASLTPTVLFLGPNGVELAERIVGVSNYDFYPWYLDKRIEIATSRLRQRLAR